MYRMDPKTYLHPSSGKFHSNRPFTNLKDSPNDNLGKQNLLLTLMYLLISEKTFNSWIGSKNKKLNFPGQV